MLKIIAATIVGNIIFWAGIWPMLPPIIATLPIAIFLICILAIVAAGISTISLNNSYTLDCMGNEE